MGGGFAKLFPSRFHGTKLEITHSLGGSHGIVHELSLLEKNKEIEVVEQAATGRFEWQVNSRLTLNYSSSLELRYAYCRLPPVL